MYHAKNEQNLFISCEHVWNLIYLNLSFRVANVIAKAKNGPEMKKMNPKNSQKV